MIKKGYHYVIDCDVKGCDLSYVVGVAKHNFDARRQAKQKIIKEGWIPGQVGTVECPECQTKREKKNAKIIADAAEKARPQAEAPEEIKEEATA